MVDWKLDIAKECGADIVLNPSKCNLMEEINKLTDGLGCDVYIEATGAGGSVKLVKVVRVLAESKPHVSDKASTSLRGSAASWSSPCSGGT